MDEFEQRSREIARAILERHGWKRPMSAEVKEMREIADEPLMECKRYLLEEWQNMRIPLLEAENAKLRELVRDMWHDARLLDANGHIDGMRLSDSKAEDYKRMDVCHDNRFELIAKARDALLESTNIEDSPDEMAVLDSILFRCWQMGWLDELGVEV